PGAGPGAGGGAGAGARRGAGGAVPGVAGLAAGPGVVARGGSTWLALGQHTAWTSPDGKAWWPAPGVPAPAGDTVLGLAGTHTGFVAVGEQTGSQPGPVVWTSTDGQAWQRESGPALGLTARGGGHVASLRWAASRGSVIVAGGPIAAGRGGPLGGGPWGGAGGGPPPGPGGPPGGGGAGPRAGRGGAHRAAPPPPPPPP